MQEKADKINIYDVSEKAKVSTATVSRVLNGSTKVSDKTKEKVLKVIRETNYIPNVFAQGLSKDSIKTVGILCSDASDSYMTQAVFFAERTLRKNNFSSILSCTGYDLADKKACLNLLISKKVDAIILIGSFFIENNSDDNQYILDAAKSVPIALVNGFIEDQNIYSVVCNEYAITKQIAKELIANGAGQDIVYLYHADSYSNRNKINGFCAALLEAGCVAPQDKVIYCPRTKMQDMIQVLEGKIESSCKAIMASDDSLAVGAVKLAMNKQLAIPDDIQIVGYNNSFLSECCVPELSTIDSRVSDISVKAVELLLQAMNGNKPPQHTMYNAALVKRKTTK